MQNLTKKQKIWIFLGILLLALYVFFDMRAHYLEVYDSLTLEYETDTIEYGSDFDPVTSLKSLTGEISYEGEVDTMKTGDYPVTYTLKAKEEKYAFPVKRDIEVLYHVEDTKEPVIELEKEEVSVYVNADYDFKENVVRVYDEVDGDIKDYETESDADLKRAGDYTVTVKAKDKNGNTGIMSYLLHVKRRPAAISSQGYRTIYSLLTGTYGYNKAAACAILANIKFESTFDPTVDGYYLGLCQWGGGRKERLFSWCAENGYDAYSIEGQIAYMNMELSNSYSGVKNYLMNAEDSSYGAYEAAVYFCERYEGAASHAGRGELASSYYDME